KLLMIFMGVLAAVTSLHAQQPLTHTQYGQLRTVLNPAASLMHRGGEVSVIGRRQWVGMDGAHTEFWGSRHIGLQKIGSTTEISNRHQRLAVEQLTEALAFFVTSVNISESV